MAALEAKFLEKTGLAYAERATTAAVAGKRISSRAAWSLWTAIVALSGIAGGRG